VQRGAIGAAVLDGVGEREGLDLGRRERAAGLDLIIPIVFASSRSSGRDLSGADSMVWTG
jgi:hypothetical protein